MPYGLAHSELAARATRRAFPASTSQPFLVLVCRALAPSALQHDAATGAHVDRLPTLERGLRIQRGPDGMGDVQEAPALVFYGRSYMGQNLDRFWRAECATAAGMRAGCGVR